MGLGSRPDDDSATLVVLTAGRKAEGPGRTSTWLLVVSALARDRGTERLSAGTCVWSEPAATG